MPRNKGKQASVKKPSEKSTKPVKKGNPKRVTRLREQIQSSSGNANVTASSKVNQSRGITCQQCNKTNEAGQWLVQCDDCDEHFHFECVGLRDIGEEDSWRCPECTKKTETSTNVQSSQSIKPTRKINKSKGKFCQNLHCDWCGVTSEEYKRFVECDVCKKIYHFECVGVTELYEEEFWCCNNCRGTQVEDLICPKPMNAHSFPNKETPSQSPRRSMSPIIVTADVHVEPEPTIEDDSLENANDSGKTVNAKNTHQSQLVDRSKSRKASNSIQFNDDLNIKKSSTRAGSLNPRSDSKPASVKSKTDSWMSLSSTSSQRSQRIQNELALQRQIDQEKVRAMREKIDAEAAVRLEQLNATEALKLKELEMKEKREKQFLKDQARSHSSRSGSIRSEKSNETNRTSYVSSWIEELSVHAKSNPAVIGHECKEDAAKMQQNNPPKSSEGGKRSDSLIENHKMFYSRIDNVNDWSISMNETEKRRLSNLTKSTGLQRETQGSKIGQSTNLINVSSANEPSCQSQPQVSSTDPNANNPWKTARITSSYQNVISSNQGYVTSNGKNQSHPTRLSKDQGYDTRYWKGQTQSTQLPQSSTSGVRFCHANNDHQRILQVSRSIPVPNNNNPCGNSLTSGTNLTWSHSGDRTYITSQMHQNSHEMLNSETNPVCSDHGNQNPNLMMSNHNQPSNCQFVSNPNNMPSTNGANLQAHISRQNHSLLTVEQLAARQVVGRSPLPIFTGNPTDWERFINKYESSTAQCGISNVENLERLDRAIQGKARDVVESLLNLPQCVPEIIDTLRDKYGRPEIIIKSVLAKIRSEPPIRHDKLEALSNFGYKVRNVRNTIESLGMHYHLHNPELVQELVDKLPHQTKIEWAKYSGSIPNVSLIHISDWLYDLSKSLHRITMPDISPTSNDRRSDKKSDDPKAKAGYVNVHDNNNSKQVKDDYKSKVKRCVICSADCKFAGECPRFKGLAVEERFKLVVENKLCRRCLRRHGGTCRISKECGENGCKFKHNSLIHSDKKMSKAKPTNQPADNDTKPPVVQNVVVGSSNTHYAEEIETLSRIVPVVVYNNGKSCLTFAFLDEGSHFTMMERHVAEKIELRGSPETICLLWTNKVSRVEQSEKANLEISGINGERSIRYPLNSVNIVKDLDLPAQALNRKVLIQKYPHLKDLPLTEYEDIKPTLIIGLRHARLSTPLETIEGGEDDPIATRCRLGWSIHGPAKDTDIGYVNAHRILQCSCQDRDADLHDMIKEHFTVENFGVAASTMSLESKDNELALELLKKYTVRKGLRFETRLLWKDESCELPDSYPMAMKRLSCLENKGSKVISTINEFIEDYIKKGYVTKLSPNEIAKKSSRTWYLPIFTVVHPKKPEKLRPVFDGAARVKGTSLNSALFTGPDLLVPIVDVLRRFREHNIAVCGDIKEMYHQVPIHEDDRNSQRFLWRYGEKNRIPDVYVMNVMTFGATCSPSAAQFVKNLNATEFQKEYPRAAEAIIKNHYVDDLMDGAETVEDAIKLVNDVKFVHSQAGFEIRNFMSNSKDLLKAIGEPINLDEKVAVESDSMIERVLGMFWDTRSDCYTFSLKFTKVSSEILSGKQLPTKREALRLLMSIFDPLGLLSYYLIHLKILIQDVWRSQAKWDDQISVDLQETWTRWVKILPDVTKLKIPRCYSINLSENVKKTEMHIFVDAGEDAFAAVAYLKVETKEGCHCALAGSKARVAPLKHLSIPRKELQAAVLGTRLLTSISNSQTFKIDRRIIWSDSETVMSWLNSNSRKYSQFVGHRVGEILESTNVTEWRWVPSKENIADEATKWSKTPTFDSSNRWFTGPDFIRLKEDKWPKKKKIKADVKEEMKAHFAHSKFVMPQWINPERFSKFDRMVRALAYATRMITFKTQEEIQNAENLIFRQAQFEGYTSEMVILERNKTLSIDKYEFIEKPSPLYDGSPYLDEKGVLRMKWRIDGARGLSYDTRRPIALPNKSRITFLLVHAYHVKYFHQNHETVFNELRQRFYIPRLRVLIKKVRSRCQMCKVKKAKVMEPQMADLPPARLAINFSPFSFVGLDFFGPMFVKIGRRKEKRWGVLFTCLTIRAVHIELAASLDTSECIMCIRNFITIHGTPIEIHSDNGSNLVGADNELQREKMKIGNKELSEKFTSTYTRWIFTAPKAAHMGGSWERLIRSVKSGLDEIMPTRTPKESLLRNLLLEAANVVNSRPLTYIPLESNEGEALTPNHFLLGSSNGHKPPCKLELDGPYLRQCWKESQRLTELFWKRFVTEYLPTITRRTKWFKPVKPLQPGD